MQRPSKFWLRQRANVLHAVCLVTQAIEPAELRLVLRFRHLINLHAGNYLERRAGDGRANAWEHFQQHIQTAKRGTGVGEDWRPCLLANDGDIVRKKASEARADGVAKKMAAVKIGAERDMILLAMPFADKAKGVISSALKGITQCLYCRLIVRMSCPQNEAGVRCELRPDRPPLAGGGHDEGIQRLQPGQSERLPQRETMYPVANTRVGREGEQKDFVVEFGQLLREIAERGLHSAQWPLVDAVHAIVPGYEVGKSYAHLASTNKAGEPSSVSCRVSASTFPSLHPAAYAARLARFYFFGVSIGVSSALPHSAQLL